MDGEKIRKRDERKKLIRAKSNSKELIKNSTERRKSGRLSKK